MDAKDAKGDDDDAIVPSGDDTGAVVSVNAPPSTQRVRIALVLMALSFVPYFVAIWMLASSDKSTSDNLGMVALVVVSNVMWTGGMLLGGKVVYDHWRERRRLRQHPEDEAAVDP